MVEQRKISSPAGNRAPARSLSLYRLRYPGSFGVSPLKTELALNKCHDPLGIRTQNWKHTRALHTDINSSPHAMLKKAGGRPSLSYYY
jgi:hypothetical protein